MAQNVGIGTTIPLARLHVTDSSILFSAAGIASATPGNPPISGGGRRMMWYADKAAFRAGYIQGFEWDKDSIGIYSFATGYNSKAQGHSSFAAGFFSQAKNNWSIAMGYQTKALQDYATSIGFGATASGQSSTALGVGSLASGDVSVAIGFNPEARGNISTALGYYTIAKSNLETVIGSCNTDYTPISTTTWSGADRLFIVGNGSDINNRSDAMVILKNGKTGIGTSLPSARLHVTDSSVLFSAAGDAPGIPGNTPISGAGRRMMWYADKAAFRSGAVAGTEWDINNIGYYSFASGYGTTAIGSYSTAIGYGPVASGYTATAMGSSTNASGNTSTAMGSSTIASGIASTAMGSSTNATGDFSTAMGGLTIASGDYSAALGVGTNAKAQGSLSAGKYNDDTDSPSPFFPVSTDRIFQIGNGTFSAKTNAVTVLRNGNTGIGTVNPATRLHIVQGPSGFGGGYFPGMVLEGDANTYFNLLSPNGSETAILFGKASDAASGGIVYNNAAHLNGMEFRTNGNATRMVLLDNGYLGIGVTDPAFRLDVGERMRLRSSGGNSAGIWLNNSANNASPAFTGMRSDNLVGFYGNNSGWGFLMNTDNGKVGIGTDVPAAQLEVNGYTKLGSDAPVIKMKKFTGTTSAAEGVGITIPHGLNHLKIISFTVIVQNAGGAWVGPNSGIAASIFHSYFNSFNIAVDNVFGASANILSKPVKVLITYEE